MKKLLFVSVMLSTLILTGCSWNKKPSQSMVQAPSAVVSTGTTGQMTKEELAAMEKAHMMKKDDMLKESIMQKDQASYIPYNELTAKSLLTAGKHVVLFFHVGRCPSCKALDSDLTTKLSILPENSVILKVDYDKAQDLKKKYGVTTQHTLIRIDSDMKLVSKNIGGDITVVAKLLQ